MDRVIEVALADLSQRINVEVPLASNPDRRAEVELFRILYQAGYVFRPTDVEHWALAHGWNPLAAIGLGEVAEGVNEGRAFPPSTIPAYPKGILETWEQRSRT